MIEVKSKSNNQPKLYEPSYIWGRPHGEIWQMVYDDGTEQKDYWITCGTCENPLHIWWDDEDNKFKLSTTDTSEELARLNSHVKARRLKKAKFNLEILI